MCLWEYNPTCPKKCFPHPLCLFHISTLQRGHSKRLEVGRPLQEKLERWLDEPSVSHIQNRPIRLFATSKASFNRAKLPIGALGDTRHASPPPGGPRYFSVLSKLCLGRSTTLCCCNQTLIGPVIFQPVENDSDGSFSRWICDHSDQFHPCLLRFLTKTGHFSPLSSIWRLRSYLSDVTMDPFVNDERWMSARRPAEWPDSRERGVSGRTDECCERRLRHSETDGRLLLQGEMNFCHTKLLHQSNNILMSAVAPAIWYLSWEGCVCRSATTIMIGVIIIWFLHSYRSVTHCCNHPSLTLSSSGY